MATRSYRVCRPKLSFTASRVRCAVELVEFGQQAFPRGSYLVGHLEAAKNPVHFVGKGYLELRFDPMGVPSGS